MYVKVFTNMTKVTLTGIETFPITCDLRSVEEQRLKRKEDKIREIHQVQKKILRIVFARTNDFHLVRTPHYSVVDFRHLLQWLRGLIFN